MCFFLQRSRLYLYIFYYRCIEKIQHTQKKVLVKVINYPFMEILLVDIMFSFKKYYNSWIIIFSSNGRGAVCPDVVILRESGAF